jgi:uncharacterized protein YuzE
VVRITYDPKADSLYIQFREAKIVQTKELDEGLIADYDGEGNLAGIEIPKLSELTALGKLDQLSIDFPVIRGEV